MSLFYTVIIPAYNAEEHLEECLRSALEQNFGSYEIIVVNDGSTDGTASLLEEIEAEYPQRKLHIIFQENQGLGAARNVAAQQASGQYCALLDADDIWLPEKLNSCHQFLKNSPECAVLYHDVIAFDESRERNRRALPVDSVESLLREGCPIVPSASIIRSDVLREEAFSTEPDHHGAEDLHLWMRLLKKGYDFYAWPEPLTYYREWGGMSSAIDDHLRRVFNVLEHFYREDWYNQTSLEFARRRKYYEAARAWQKRGERFKAERYYAAADSKSMKIAGMRFLNWLGISW